MYLRGHNGSVAQLNRASDSGSAGRGFESHRGHKKSVRPGDRFFCLPFNGSLSVFYEPVIGLAEMVVTKESVISR